jgi:hypothetical protein
VLAKQGGFADGTLLTLNIEGSLWKQQQQQRLTSRAAVCVVLPTKQYAVDSQLCTLLWLVSHP